MEKMTAQEIEQKRAREKEMQEKSVIVEAETEPAAE